MDSTTHTTTTVEFVDWRAKAKEKLEAEDKLFKGGRAAASVQSYVLRALLNFADQEPRFAEVVCNTERTFSECCAAVVHNAGEVLSDLEAYRKAVQFYKVHQGTVLYLALEDDYARLQHRLSRMFGVEEAASLYFATQAKTLSEGLDQQLEHFIREHPDVRLIIIDTLQKVREVGGDRYSYASDYEIVTKLKAFSDKYGICLLVVHHTRKMEAEDSFDMIWSIRSCSILLSRMWIAT